MYENSLDSAIARTIYCHENLELNAACPPRADSTYLFDQGPSAITHQGITTESPGFSSLSPNEHRHDYVLRRIGATSQGTISPQGAHGTLPGNCGVLLSAFQREPD